MSRATGELLCVRCGGLASGDDTGHCDPCEAAYQAELRDSYAAGQPRAVVVGSAFGGELAIWVHDKPEHCGCRGTGWHCTALDSLHPCPVRTHEGPHPDAY